MDAIFMIPEIVKHLIFADFYLRKTFTFRKVFYLRKKRSNEYVASSNLIVYYTWINLKSHMKIINIKY